MSPSTSRSATTNRRQRAPLPRRISISCAKRWPRRCVPSPAARRPNAASTPISQTPDFQFDPLKGLLMEALVIPFEKLRMTDVEQVGGKNSSLGEMISQLADTGVRVPGGFATTFPMDLTIAITEQYQRLVADSTADMSFAVRSSATAEDLPDASFAGQQETFLNIVGLENIMHAIKEVFASLYNDRAISYRVHKGFVHADVALSAGIQRMVRSDKGAAGGEG